MNIVDPFGALAEIILGYHKSGILQGWLKLLFGIGFSFAISFNTACGAMLVAHAGWQVSIGTGMCTAAAMAFLAFLRANQELTAGVVVAVPQRTTTDQFDSKGSGPEVITASGKP